MAIKKILDDFQNALSIAQAGIKGTLSALRNPQAKRKKRTREKLTPKPKAKARPKRKLPGKNPTDPMVLARSVVEAATGESFGTPKKPKYTSVRKAKKPKRSSKA